MPKSIRLLSGGPGQSLVKRLQDRFATERGFAIRGTFGATGAMQDKLVAGEPCDLVILPQTTVDELSADGHLVAASQTTLGVVRTGIAVKAGEPVPQVGTPDALKATLLGARGVYIPDPVKATAGIHFMQVIKSLGIEAELTSRLHLYPNGASAMRDLAQFPEEGLIGWTHVTQILNTPGVELAGLIPASLDIATVYIAAICTKAQEPEGASQLIRMLAGADAAAMRSASGFEPV